MHGGSRRDESVEREEADERGFQRFKKVTWRRLQKPGFGVFGIVRVCFLYTSHEKVLQRASESIFGVSESIFYTLHM